MGCASCKEEFKVKNFGFSDVLPNLFYRLQWSRNPGLYFFYRLFMMLYVVIWMIVGYITALEDNFWQFLTYWTEGLMVVYFIVAFGVSVYGVIKAKSEAIDSEGSSLRWFHRLNWILFSTASTSAFIISALFWFTLAPTRTAAENFNPVTFHVHGTNSILFLIEIFMVAFPVRFYHFVYPIAYGLLYGVFVIILHYTGVNSSIYPATDFEANLGFAFAFALAAPLVASFIVHSIIFLLYLLRNLIVKRTKGDDSVKGMEA